MARLVRAYRGSNFSAGGTLLLVPQFHQRLLSHQPYRPVPNFRLHTRTYVSAETLHKSLFESNILRILRNEIQYQSEYAPPHQPPTEFNTFNVQDRPGEQWITLRGKFGENETLKLEATMFDGSLIAPRSGDESTGNDVHLHISLLVDISKGEGCDLEFVCSAWPDRIEIQKVYIFDGTEGSLPHPYLGPNFRDLDKKLQHALSEFLKTRGVNDDLSVFLHQFMANKDRIELIQWLKNLKYFVEK